MSDLAPTNAPPGAVSPSFCGAFRGIWLFTWRSQLSWRRLPLNLGLLLALPVLVYLTTVSPRNWAGHERSLLLGSPREQLSELSGQLFRAGCPVSPEKRQDLFSVFREEITRNARGAPGLPSTETTTNLAEQVNIYYDRIQSRVATVLDERQMTQFEIFRKRQLALRQERASEPQWGRSAPFYHWLIDFYFFVILPFNCVRACGALIRDELQADTLGYLITRPISRARLLVLKYLSQIAWLQLLMLAETLLIFATGQVRQMPELGIFLPLFLAAQLLAVPAWGALGLFLGQVTNRYLAVAILYGLIVELGIGSIPTNINTLSLIRHLKTLLSHNAPLQAMYQWTATGVPLAVAALVLATALFLTAAALLFNFKEYLHSAEMQK